MERDCSELRHEQTMVGDEAKICAGPGPRTSIREPDFRPDSTFAKMVCLI